MSGDAHLWGAETDKAVANFPVSGEPIPAEAVVALPRLLAPQIADPALFAGRLSSLLSENMDAAGGNFPPVGEGE